MPERKWLPTFQMARFSGYTKYKPYIVQEMNCIMPMQ